MSNPQEQIRMARGMTLKPCPFCGGRGVLFAEAIRGGVTYWNIGCITNECFEFAMRKGFAFPHSQLAAELNKWNRRATPSKEAT